MPGNDPILCSLCAQIDIVSLIEGLDAYKTRSRRHHATYAALVQASDAGCELCILFQATLSSGARHSITQANGRPAMLSRSSTSFSTKSDMNTNAEAKSWHEELDRTPGVSSYTLEVQAESTLDTDFEAQYGISLTRRYPVAGSDETVRSRRLLLSNDYDLGLGIRNREISKFPSFTIYSQWIRSCAHGARHTRCTPAEPVELPSRVIDVGGGSGSEVPKLIESKGIKDFYVTLSHCWGKTRPLTTTLANFDTHKTGLSFSKFPKQFQDAAIITKIMGYRYLWIDSLCIVQDDTRDWEQECFRMGDIYRNSVCTLAAPVASNSESGLLNERPAPLVPSCKLKASRDGEVIGYVSVGLPSGDFKEWSSPLASRAWVLQEQLMSPRTLYFAPRGMYFQCHSHEQLETYHYPMPPERLTPWRTREASDMPKTIISMTTRDDISYWYAVVRQYCFRYLTFGDDKLPALSGLAKVVSEQAAEDNDTPFGEYLAGLWSSDLGRGLLWVSAGPYDASKTLHPVDKLAPTWSWASQNQPVEWKVLKDFKPQFERLVSAMELTGQNKFGRVQRGLLELKGHAVSCVLRRSPGSKPLLLCVNEHDAREAAEVMLDATSREVLDARWKASKQTFACRLLRLGYAQYGQRWFALLLCPAAASHTYQRIGIAYSLDEELVHARSLTTQQSYQWLDNARSDRIKIV